MATQTLRQTKPKNFKVEFTGQLKPSVTAKDMVLKMIGLLGTAGGTGYCAGILWGSGRVAEQWKGA